MATTPTATAHVFNPPPSSKKAEEEADNAEKKEITYWNKCCCFHVTTGLYVIGTLEMVLLVAQLASVAATYVLIGDSGTNGTVEGIESPFGSSYKDYNWIYDQSPISVLGVAVGSTAVGITVVILMMVGVRKSKGRLLVPHMIAQVIGILALFAGSAIFIYAAVTVSSSKMCNEVKHGDACTKVLLGFCGFIVSFTFFAGLQIYFLIVTIRGYRYMKEKCKTNQSTPSPYYALYQRQYQQQEGQPAPMQYMQQHPIYATYAQPMAGYAYGYRYA